MLSLNLFIGHRIVFFFIFFVGIGITYMFWGNWVWMLLLASIWSSLLVIIYSSAIYKFNKLVNISTTEKSISTYINKVANLYKKQRKKECKACITPYLATGYLNIGDLESLKVLLDKEKEKRWSDTDMYHYFLACYSIENNDFETATNALKTLNGLIIEEKNPLVRTEMVKQYLLCRMILRISECETFCDTEYLCFCYENERVPMKRSCVAYYYAICLFRKGEFEKGIYILRDAIECCPESFYAKKAVNDLISIGIDIDITFEDSQYIRAESLFD